MDSVTNEIEGHEDLRDVRIRQRTIVVGTGRNDVIVKVTTEVLHKSRIVGGTRRLLQQV